jgi:hypothetical protein
MTENLKFAILLAIGEGSSADAWSCGKVFSFGTGPLLDPLLDSRLELWWQQTHDGKIRASLREQIRV